MDEKKRRQPLRLDKFQDCYFDCLKIVKEIGSFTIKFESDLIASGERFRFYELFRSIADQSDNKDLIEDVRNYRITWKKGSKWMTIYDSRTNKGTSDIVKSVENQLRIMKEESGMGSVVTVPSDDDILSMDNFE